MGAIGGLLGTAGGSGGSGFNTPSGTNSGQLETAYGGNQAGLAQQQALLQALQGQGGLANQTQVYNQLQNIASGQGPNPAQAMLNQATGANVANQAALQAGQRGANANVGLMARQIGQQGANIQQQSAGQGATMQANQSLGALGQAGQLANTMAGNQIGQTNANVTGQQNAMNILQGANTANNNIQGNLANTTMQGQQALLGGAMNAMGSGASMMGGSGGGGAGMAALAAAGGGEVPTNAFGQSMFAQSLNNTMSQGNMPTYASSNPGSTDLEKGMSKLVGNQQQQQSSPQPMQDMGGGLGSYVDAGPNTMAAAKGGEVKVVVSPGEKLLKPNEAQAVANGKANPMSMGKMVPGKAPVKGDSYKNDTVPTKLPPGSVVIPRSVMQSKDPVRGAAQFVQDVMSKKGKR